MDNSTADQRTGERHRRIYKFRTALVSCANGFVEAAVLAYTALEDIKAKGDQVEQQLAALEETLNDVEAEDTQLTSAVTASAGETKLLVEDITTLSPGNITQEKIDALTAKAQNALAAQTTAVQALETATNEASKITSEGESGKPITADKTQYMYTGSGAVPSPLPENWTLSTLVVPAVPQAGEVAEVPSAPLYEYALDEATTSQSKGADSDWQVYTGPFAKA